jgi:hypothetical protein
MKPHPSSDRVIVSHHRSFVLPKMVWQDTREQTGTLPPDTIAVARSPLGVYFVKRSGAWCGPTTATLLDGQGKESVERHYADIGKAVNRGYMQWLDYRGLYLHRRWLQGEDVLSKMLPPLTWRKDETGGMCAPTPVGNYAICDVGGMAVAKGKILGRCPRFATATEAQRFLEAHHKELREDVIAGRRALPLAPHGVWRWAEPLFNPKKTNAPKW